MSDFEVPEDMEIEMVMKLQTLGSYLHIFMPTHLKD